MAIPSPASTVEQLLELYATYDRASWSTWHNQLQRSQRSPELDQRSGAVLIVGLDAVVHWSLPVLERHYEEAFDAGCCIVELIEAVLHLSSLEGGVHAMHDSFEALDTVIRRRRSAGVPVPLSGYGLGPEDMQHEAPWPVPAVFPYHAPSPRMHNQVLAEYHPRMWEAFKSYRLASFEVRTELTRRMQELLVTACDTAITWPEPLLDHHLHAAYEVGTTTQELVETILLAACAVPGAQESSLAGRRLDGGVVALRHGLRGLDRVLEQRLSHGLLARADESQPHTGLRAIPAPGLDATLPPSMRDDNRR